jgi:hypothetical protein
MEGKTSESRNCYILPLLLALVYFGIHCMNVAEVYDLLTLQPDMPLNHVLACKLQSRPSL